MEKVVVKDLAKIGGAIVQEILSDREKWQFVSDGTNNNGLRWCVFSVRDMVFIGKDLRKFEMLVIEEVGDDGSYSVHIDNVYELKE